MSITFIRKFFYCLVSSNNLLNKKQFDIPSGYDDAIDVFRDLWMKYPVDHINSKSILNPIAVKYYA
jgi:hypothetical protein